MFGLVGTLLICAKQSQGSSSFHRDLRSVNESSDFLTPLGGTLLQVPHLPHEYASRRDTWKGYLSDFDLTSNP